MNARASENYLAISRSSSASKSVEIVWAEIYWGRLFFRAESSLIQSSCRSFIGVIVPYEIPKVNFLSLIQRVLAHISIQLCGKNSLHGRSSILIYPSIYQRMFNDKTIFFLGWHKIGLKMLKMFFQQSGHAPLPL